MMFAYKLMFPGKQLWVGSKDAGLLVVVQVIKFPLLGDDLENRRTGWQMVIAIMAESSRISMSRV
jgi:hypothetical protein